MVRTVGFEPTESPSKIKGSGVVTHEETHVLTLMLEELAAIVIAWPHLALPLKAAIMSIINSQKIMSP